MEMDSLFLTFGVVGLAFATTFLIQKMTPEVTMEGRYATIDGMRGYIAMFIYIHHGYIWHNYIRTSEWHPAPSHLYMHLGQSSVAFFFMVTSFLFFNKLLSVRGGEMEWKKYFLSRLLRLGPMYFFVMAIFFVIVAIETSGRLNISGIDVIAQSLQWLLFSIRQPDINGLEDTGVILAGVTWTLPYEWFFYFSLPLMALLLRIRVPIIVILICLAVLLVAIAWGPHKQHLFSFAGGIIAAILSRFNRFTTFAKTTWASFIIVAALITMVIVFPSPYSRGPLLLLTVSFSLIACGNSLFGLLANRTAKMLGDMAYSIYLLHGVVLYIVIRYLLGFETVKQFSESQHVMLLFAVTPCIVLISYMTFRGIEQTGMSLSKTLSTRITNNRGWRVFGEAAMGSAAVAPSNKSVQEEDKTAIP